MPSYEEQKIMRYNPVQMFNLVADVEKYPDFLPWCISSKVYKNDKNIIEATLLVGFHFAREKFRSRVELDHNNYSINTKQTHGPFKYLSNSWKFKEHPEGCKVYFFIDFELRSPILKKIMTTLFAEAAQKMVISFENRAQLLYGNSKIKSYNQ